MPKPFQAVLDHLQRVLMPINDDPPDGQLLVRFLTSRDEESFATLVRRHGPMVLSLCRRILHHEQDAEDCFQATFLVLARKAAVVKRQSVGSFLYGVAYRIALEARAINARRRAREKQVQEMPHHEVLPAEAQDWRPLLDRELHLLPEHYRAVIVACDLQGLSRKEAARHLGLSEGTLSSRLARGRCLLAKRLSRHGLALGGALTATLAEGAAVPAPLLFATVKAALQTLAISSTVEILVKGALRTMFLAKLKLVLGAVMVVATFAVGGLCYRAWGQAAPAAAEQKPEDSSPSELEALRRENELLKVNLEVVLEKVRGQEAPRKRPRIVVSSPRAKDVLITQQYVCRIYAQRYLNVRALQAGVLQEVRVKEGQAVKKGEVMFKLDPARCQAKYEAELAEVRIARIELDNTKKLFKDKVVSSLEVALQQAKLDRAQARAKVVKADLDFTIVRAAFDGVVDRLHEQAGSPVRQGDVLTILCDNSLVWVYFNVPEKSYLEYKAGRDKEEPKVELVLANGSKFPKLGKITAIDARFNGDTGNISFRADFENPDRLLRHGQSGTVLIHRTLHNAIVIPQRADFEILNKRYVWVVGKDDVVRQREVVIQNELEDIFVIKSGLDVNDRFVLEGVRQVRDGEKVEYKFRKAGLVE